ncbi:MAG: alkaline phosphatase, partial [Candidatus Azotimanducaceae bacterium]
TNKDYQQIASVPLPVETHAGEDVAIFAEGLGAESIRGVMEQNRIFHAMHKALFGTGEQ